MSGQSSQSRDGRPQNETYFCVLCPDIPEVRVFNTKTDIDKHLREEHLKDSSQEESHAIDLWIERHLKYQESLNRSMAQSIKTIPDRNKTIYRGCPVCDRIIKVFNIRSDPYPKGSDAHELLIRDINIDYSGNNVNHINPHLKYYPYDCLICKEEYEKSKLKGDLEVSEGVKTSVKPMMRRHIIDKHMKDSPLTRDDFEKEVEKAIITKKVMILERITKRSSPPPGPQRKRIKIPSIPGPPRAQVKTEPPKRTIAFTPIKTATVFQKSLPQNKSHDPKYFVPIAPNPFSKTEGPVLTQNVISFGKPFMNLNQANMSQARFLIPITYKNVSKIEINSGISVPEMKESKLLEKSSSEEELSDSTYDLMKDKREVFGCIFCAHRFKTYDKVFDHILEHIDVFIGCPECDLKFKTISDFRIHNTSHNENCNPLNVNQFKIVKKWTENFLNLCRNERQTLLDMTHNMYTVYCPVCQMVERVYGYESDRPLPEGETQMTHIYKHMNYFPYECIDCFCEDIKTEFVLDSKAKQHLYDKHDIKDALKLSENDLKKYFNNKNSSVSKFEERIIESIDISKQMKNFFPNSEEYSGIFKSKCSLK